MSETAAKSNIRKLNVRSNMRRHAYLFISQYCETAKEKKTNKTKWQSQAIFGKSAASKYPGSGLIKPERGLVGAARGTR